MKRHTEAESRYLQQDQLRRDIEYANSIFHYVWYIRPKQRTSNPVKQQTKFPLSDLDYPPPPCKKSNCNVLNRKSDPVLKSSKRLKHSQTNKPVNNTAPERATSPPSPVPPIVYPNTSLLAEPSGMFHTPDFSDSLSTDETFPFPGPDYATYLAQGITHTELNRIPCCVSCLQEPETTTSFASMAEWNNLNI